MKSIDDFLNRIEAMGAQLGIKNRHPWFRGHSKEQYDLVPLLLRPDYITQHQVDDLVRFEKNMVCDFITRAGDALADPMAALDGRENWHLLSLMRHYEMPTRLLDWTTSLSVALYFAIGGDEAEDAHIWIMNPSKLNMKSTGSPLIFDAVDIADFSYLECLIGKVAYPYAGPIAVTPAMTNPRIRAQRGCFTFHGDGLGKHRLSKVRPINGLRNPAAARLDIPKALIEKLKTLLHFDGVDEYFIYPELHNLSKAITRNAIAGRKSKSSTLPSRAPRS